MSAVRLQPAFAAAVCLAACSSLPATVGTVTPVAVRATSLTRYGAPVPHKSWLKAGTSKNTLLYVSDNGSSSVTVYAATGGDTFSLVGELFGFQSPLGACTDTRGNVFVTDASARTIVEYAHGSITPKTVIADDFGQPYGCTIDRKSGRLAVTNLSNPSGGEPGNVIIYSSLSGEPTEYADSRLYEPLFCAFDAKGNLYVDAYDNGFHGVLSELPNGNSTFVALTISGGSLNVPGGVEADGLQILLGDSYDPKTLIEQLSVSGSTATVTKKIALNNTHTIGVFTLYGSGSSSVVIAPDYDYSNLQVYQYPGGGSSLGSITAGIDFPVAAVVSAGKAK